MSIEPDQCRNCGCERTRRRFKRRDCCGKCFYLFEYLRTVERWDLDRPETLKQLSALERRPGGNPVPSIRNLSAHDFMVFKASYIEQIKGALELLRIREAKRRGQSRVDGLSIEHKLKDMLKLIQLRDKYDRAASKFHGLATMLDHTFSPEQCRILYNLLDDIEEQTYGRVAEGYKALEAIFQSKQREAMASPAMVPMMAEPVSSAPSFADPPGRISAGAYQPHDIVRRVQQGGRVSLLGRIVRVPKCYRGKDVAFRPTVHDGVFDVVFQNEVIKTIDVRTVGRDGRSIPPLNAPAPSAPPAYSLVADTGRSALPPA